MAVQALKEHSRRMAEERLRLGPDWQDSGLVFVDPFGGPIDPDRVTDRLKAVLKSAGLPADRPVHKLRTTPSTLTQVGSIPDDEDQRTPVSGGLDAIDAGPQSRPYHRCIEGSGSRARALVLDCRDTSNTCGPRGCAALRGGRGDRSRVPSLCRSLACRPVTRTSDPGGS